MSSNSVDAIIKDHHGLLWFATEQGLNKYDGTNITVYRPDNEDSSSIAGGDVNALYEDPSGNLWVGTNKGVSLYDRKKDAFITFNDKWHNNSITSLCGDYLGNIWAASYGGLYLIHPKSRTVTRFDVDSLQTAGRSATATLTVFEDSRRRLWVGSNNGLFRYDRKSGVFRKYINIPQDASTISGNSIKAIAEDVNNNIWFGTQGGLNRYIESCDCFERIQLTLPGGGIHTSGIYAITPDETGTLWVGTEDGLFLFNFRKKEINIIVPDVRNKYALSRKSVRSIFIDPDGICWIGTFQGGINKYDRNLSLFSSKIIDYFDPMGLNSPVVTSFAEASDGQVFVGTDGGGVYRFDRQSGLLSKVSVPAVEGKGLSGLSTLALLGDSKGQLWIGAYAGGLYRIPVRGGRAEHFSDGNGISDMNGNDVFCLLEDRTGKIWIGTNGKGLNVFQPRNKTFAHYSSKLAAPSYLPLNGYIRALAEDRNGKIWIGSNGTGVAAFTPAIQTFQLYDHANSGLPDNTVLSLLCDRSGALWVSTIAGGLSRFDSGKQRFVNIDIGKENKAAVVYKILEDKSGILWFSTNRSILSFDPIRKSCKRYNRFNGVQDNDFVRGAGLALSDGTLFLGGIDGFNYFNPGNLTINSKSPVVMFTDLKVGNQSVTAGPEAPIKDHISVAKEIELDYKQSFSVSFVGLNYTTPQENKYSYKLNGLDKDWNNIGGRRTAYFTSLEPGSYILEVNAINSDGVISKNPATLQITIHPPIWKTFYAYAIYFIFAGCILLALRQLGIRRLRRQFAQEQAELRHKQSIEQAKGDARREHELDQLKIKFLTNLSHEFRTPISLILGPVEQLLLSERETGRNAQLKIVKRNARRLLNLVNQLLDFRKMEEHELKLNSVYGDLSSFVREVGDSFRDLSDRKNICFKIETTPDDYYTNFDQDKLERVLFNLLSNAFKFTLEGGTIQLRLYEIPAADGKENSVRIEVADNGIGVPPDKQEAIFDRFFQHSSSKVLNQGSGIGLSITREFVEMHGGKVFLEQNSGQGSIFVVELPFKRIPGTVGDPHQNDEPLVDEAQMPEMDDDSSDVQESGSLLPVILLVEDNEDFRFYLKENLKSTYKVHEASNGKEGWRKVLAVHPEVIVSDITMPLMDGVEMVKKIKADKRTKHIPVILLTALAGEAAQLTGLETGANDYIVKPFNFQILHIRIKNLLQLNAQLKSTYSKQLQMPVTGVVTGSEDEQLMQKIMAYIEEYITSDKLSVEEIGRHVGMSRTSLYNRIIELTGLTPVEFIRSVKLDKAASLLETTDLTIAEVGYLTGFTVPNYFAKSFKKKFNMLPSEYIQIKRSNNLKTGNSEDQQED